MRKRGLLSKFLTLFVTATVALPNSALALRPMLDKAGLEEALGQSDNPAFSGVSDHTEARPTSFWAARDASILPPRFAGMEESVRAEIIAQALEGKLSVRQYLELTESEKQHLRAQFQEVFKPRLSETARLIYGDKAEPNTYPLTKDPLTEQLVTSAQTLSSTYPNDKIVALGRSPLWFVETARLLEGSPERYEYVAFSGRWYERGQEKNRFGFESSGSAALRPGPVGPNSVQIQAYRTYLSNLGLDPIAIVRNAEEKGRKTIVVEYTQFGESLMSFLSVLSDWAEEQGLGARLRAAVVVHVLQDPVLKKIPYLAGFQLERQIVDHELVRNLANSDAFEDSLGVHYPYWKWTEFVPASLGAGTISRNAALVRFRVMDFLAQKGLLKAREAAPPIHAGMEEPNPIRAIPIQRMTSSELQSMYGIDRATLPSDAAFVIATAQVASQILFYYMHDTVEPGLARLMTNQKDILPKGIELALVAAPASPDQLRRPGGLFVDRWLPKKYEQFVLPEIPVTLGEPLPSLPSLILWILRGAGGEIIEVKGVLKLEDNIFAYFV